MAEPTPAELEILQILWAYGESKVQAVNDRQCETREVGYTTTLKIMQNMTEKGLLDRRKDGKSHVYFPVTQEADTQLNLLDKFIAAAFGGSKSKLVMQLLGGKDMTDDEIREIKQFIKQQESEHEKHNR